MKWGTTPFNIHILRPVIQFSLQRTRFGLWGESVGLIPNPNDGRCLPYNENIDRRDIRPGVESILNNIRLLLQEADRVDERYGLKIISGRGSDISTSIGLNIFKDSFERFKSRIKKNQKQKSAWKVTRWAIHDATKFESLINRLEKYVDGLEKLTDSLGRLEKRLREEIDSISDVQSLRLLRDASSSYRNSSQNDISDAASRRLTRVSETILETQTQASSPATHDTGTSFITADSRPQSLIGSLPSSDLPLPGAWPRSVTSESSQRGPRAPPPAYRAVAASKPSRSCAECLEEHYKCEPHSGASSCSRCHNKDRSCSFDRELTEQGSSTLQEEAKVAGSAMQLTNDAPDDVLRPEEVPQNQRLLSELVQKAKPRKPLSFEVGDSHYGESLETIKTADINSLLHNSAKFLSQANDGPSAAKRMFFELRNIRTGNVPFVSAAPVSDSLDKVLASIEGPPETPYEGGVFWITVRLSDKDVMGPPLMRFHTKIYHPNISPQGHICADYKDKWSSVFSTRARSTVTSPDALWYHGKSQDIHWSLGALLTALCGLLASPDVEDPLVPEIAHKYLTDYDGYCEAAKLYTQRYATGERPNENDLVFLDDEMSSEKDSGTIASPLPTREHDVDIASIQRSLREIYDEPFPDSDSLLSRKISDEISDSGMRISPSPIESRLRVEQTQKEAIELYQTVIDSHINDASFLNHGTYSLLLRSIHDKINEQWNCNMWWRPTDIDVSYGLLKGVYRFGPIASEEQNQWHLTAMEHIKLYFAKLAMGAKKITVSDPPVPELGTRNFVVTVDTAFGQKWNVLADIRRFINLGSVYLSQTKTVPSYIPSFTNFSASILQQFLAQVLSHPGLDLLLMVEFVDLILPTIDPCNDFNPTKYDVHQARTFSTPPNRFSAASFISDFQLGEDESGSEGLDNYVMGTTAAAEGRPYQGIQSSHSSKLIIGQAF